MPATTGREFRTSVIRFGVAGLVLEDLGSTDEAIAGLLHDVLEDQDSDHVRADEIEREFGPDVLSMVKAGSGPKSEDEGMADFRTASRSISTISQHSTAQPGCCARVPGGQGSQRPVHGERP